MREGLRALTVRGRAFLAAGLTAVTAAIIVGQDSVVRIGVLVTALPLLTAWWIGRSRYRLALTRVVAPRTVSAGQSAEVALTLSNDARTPTGVLMLEERLPYLLGTRPRFVLEGLGTGWRRHATYPIRSELRGRFEIGPMTVRVSDPFGLIELGRTFHATTTLTVTPRTVPLAAIPLDGAWSGSGENRPRTFATGSAEDVTVREYRSGDDLRRVHWRSSARTGELMVRREEQPWQSRATVYLDNRSHVHRGQGLAGSWEAAVSATASVAVHLAQRGYVVRLITAAGNDAHPQWHSFSTAASTTPLLESLAVVDLATEVTPQTQWLAEPGQGGLTVGIFGLLEAHDQPFLRRLRHHSSVALALGLDAPAWVRESTPEPAVSPKQHLLATGWRATDLGPGDHLSSAWQELGRVRPTPASPVGAPR